MPKAPLFDATGERVGDVSLDDYVFGRDLNSHLLHEVVKMYRANRRSGSASAKSRSAITGSRAKIWPQKGTGRARHGDRKANLFRGGGVAHPPQQRDHRYSVPLKVRRLALCMALSDRAKDDKVLVFKEFNLEEPKTSEFHALLEKIGVRGKRALLMSDKHHENLLLSGRNIPGISVIPSSEVNAMDVLQAEYVVFDEDGLGGITERLSR